MNVNINGMKNEKFKKIFKDHYMRCKIDKKNIYRYIRKNATNHNLIINKVLLLILMFKYHYFGINQPIQFYIFQDVHQVI